MNKLVCVAVAGNQAFPWEPFLCEMRFGSVMSSSVITALMISNP